MAERNLKWKETWESRVGIVERGLLCRENLGTALCGHGLPVLLRLRPQGIKRVQYFILILGKIEGRRRGWQRVRWLDDITDSMDTSLSKLWKIVKEREPWCAAIHGVAKNQKWLSNWTTKKYFIIQWHQQDGEDKLLETIFTWAFLVARLVKNPPAVQEIQFNYNINF